MNLVSIDDASAIESNPANLGFLPSWSLATHHASLRSDSRFDGEGNAFWFGIPLRLFGTVPLGTYGLGIQWLRPSSAIGYANSVKLSFGGAIGTPRIALGTALHTFFSDEDEAIDDLTTWDLGLTLRLFPWLGVGIVAHNLNTPQFDGFPIERRYDMQLEVRPWRRDIATISVGTSIGERRGNVDPNARFSLRVLKGLTLIGGIDLVRRDFFRDEQPFFDVRVDLGLAFDFDFVRLSQATLFGRSLPQPTTVSGSSSIPIANPSAYQGMAFTLGLHGEKRASIIPTRAQTAHLRLTGTLNESALINLVRFVERLEFDRSTSGILIELDNLSLTMAEAQEFRGLIKTVRRWGKTVYVYLHHGSTLEYYVAAAASRILVDTSGSLELTGLLHHTFYLRDLLDWIGITPEAAQIAEYKSAPELFTQRAATKPAREARQAMLDDLFRQLVEDLARDRRVSIEATKAFIDKGPYLPSDARQTGLVDILVEDHELKKTVERHSQSHLVKAETLNVQPDHWPIGPAIAVVTIEGDIIVGESRPDFFITGPSTGDQSVVQVLSRIRRSSEIKAVVVRINSPGGSARASRRIWHELKQLRSVKPTIVSLGEIAASGGYYAASAGGTVFSQPATITGSIGIFSLRFNAQALLKKLGINVELYSHGKHAPMEAFVHPYSDEERQIVMKRLRYYYRQFIDEVARGRALSPAEIESVARGRIWTGRQAQQHKLIDRLGGLREAIDEAKRQAHLSEDVPTRIVTFGPPKTFINELLRRSDLVKEQELLTHTASQLFKRMLPASWLWTNSDDALMRLPFHLSTR